MIVFLIIVIIGVIVIYFVFFNKTEENSNTDTLSGYPEDDNLTNSAQPENSNSRSFSEAIPKPVLALKESEYLFDENGNKYQLITKTREVPRRTYLHAQLLGKYWGEINENITSQFQYSQFFDFNIYEASLTKAKYKTTPFDFIEDDSFPKDKLPRLLPITLESKSFDYEVNLFEPKFAKIKFNRKLHQNEGAEVFGTIESTVTGYILDFVTETYQERQYSYEQKNIADAGPTGTLLEGSRNTENVGKSPGKSASEITHKPSSGNNNLVDLKKTTIPSGNVEYSGNYTRSQFYFSNYTSTYWSDWKYHKDVQTSMNRGCMGSVFNLIAIIFWIAFFLLMLPQIVVWLPFFLIFWIISLIPGRILKWVFQIVGILLIIGLAWTFINFLKQPTSTTPPKPEFVRNEQELKTETEQVIDSKDKKVRDTIIRHFRAWEDYNGNQYEGMIWTKQSEYSASKNYKNNVSGYGNPRESYDRLIYLLKENDKFKLNGVLQLFDKIEKEKKLSRVEFAEVIVSFVQDIPYALILPQSCDPEMYADRFIKNYLTSPDAICEAYQLGGINSPVEFMSNLKGDCDTRTLLLYTILSYYKYDVALLSSEHYQHSLIGINLPITGIAYQYDFKKYVLWETTAPNMKPGILPNEISNLNYWRISLKST